MAGKHSSSGRSRRERTHGTVLLDRGLLSWIVVGIVITLIAGVYTFVQVYPVVPKSAHLLLEAVSGLFLLTGTVVLLGIIHAIRQTRRLIGELRNPGTAASPRFSERAHKRFRSDLTAAIELHNASRERSRQMKTERIRVQQALIRTVLRAVPEKILVLSGIGEVTYRSGGRNGDGTAETGTEAQTPLLEPSGPALAAHLLAGKGAGKVTVDGVPMHFTGVFGMVATGSESVQAIESDLVSPEEGLAYIVITEAALTSLITPKPEPLVAIGIRHWFERGLELIRRPQS